LSQDKGLARLARARSRSVLIVSPVARAPVLDYTASLAETAAHLTATGIRFALRFVVGSSNLPRARNELVAQFLASDFTDLLFVDDDMGWRPEAVVRLLASERPVIGAVGRKKVEKPNSDADVWCCRFEPEALAQGFVSDDMGAIRIAAIGTGFLKIERRVFETLIAAHPEWKRAGHEGMSQEVAAQYYKFFRFDDGEEEKGEDFYFCDQWRAAGGEIWADPTIWLSHTGVKAWSGALAEILVSEI
jgi:hypothetical protein